MVTYGPWQEGRIHEEILYAKVSVTADPPTQVELLSPEPTRPSGWRLFNTNGGFDAQGDVQWTYDGGLTDPPPADPDKSLAAFGLAMGAPVGSGSALQFSASSRGSRNKAAVGSPWVASHGWSIAGMEHRTGYTYLNDMGAEYAVPAGFDPMTSDYYTELEPWVLSDPADITLLSARVLEPGVFGYFGLFCKDAGTGEPFLHHGPTSIDGSKINRAPFDLDVDTMAAWMAAIREDGGIPGYSATHEHPAMPRVSWLYDGPPMSDPHFDGARLVAEQDGMPVAIKIRYQFPRWRQVFYADTTVPYRRIYPRDDSLAGGAGRNYPRPRSVQSSNRTSGYL